MKNIHTSKLMFILFICMLINLPFAQASNKFKFHKVSKDVKKEAKRYKKDGWSVEPGNLPIKNQLETAYTKQTETDKEGFPKYIIANGSSVAGTQSAAEMQALELAKNRLVGLIETQMKDVISSDVANDQLDRKDAITLTKTIETSTNTVCKKLGRVLPLFKVYRNIKNNNTEVQVLIAYNYELVRQQILEEMKTELKFDTEDQRKKFDKFLSAEEYKKGEIRNVSEG
jgi:hypothetical protein